MGAMSNVIAAISDDVVSALALGGYPPLTPAPDGTAGRILVGTAALFEASSPPRIIFEPVGSKFGAPSYFSASNSLSTTERRNQATLRTIEDEDVQYLCRCWGASPTGDVADDYDVTRALYHQVRASMQKLLPGCFSIDGTGKYTAGSNVNRDGREFTFGVSIFSSVLDALAPYALANQTPAQQAVAVALRHPSGPITVVGTERFIDPAGNGASEPGCS